MGKFADRLGELGFASYADYLASDVWREFKARYKAAGHQRKCLICSARPVQLHHKTYVRLGREEFTDVVPLCRDHHVAVHDWLKSSGRLYVEYTHEAVAALGGKVVTLPADRSQEIHNKKARRKKDNRPKCKADVLAFRESRRSNERPPLTKKERRALERARAAEALYPRIGSVRPRVAAPFQPNAKAEPSRDSASRLSKMRAVAVRKKGGPSTRPARI